MTFPALPCFPCPHHSACCAHGSTLAEDEAEAIMARHGIDRIYLTRWGEWRTRVTGGRCAFLVDNACELHDESFYPLVCQGFPWTDSETGGPYEFDRTICPEFERRPELVEINPYLGRNGGRKG
jgi:hypothetical protein